ncbi:single-stranded-DNA-specific exonuclease RecJ [Lactobacillus psittaci]|uniref:Single-stranded-DNA-specific exonuclease RecJ n=1 Tax=Lactobacillus psittaci DSM 15354 TaxID=1122152 RepID=A0A0R1S4V3_9LACO|nr:single-stranded-DNA-specific exonuclease RecJ [Lactobacillus psittaci]KRL64039.1 single-stranded-DNA-specific exonuclease [Lactobacillus psittaci DSM 15354]
MIWKEKKQDKLDENLVAEFQLSPIEAKLFSLRGINTSEKLDFWLNGSENNFADPYLMHDMKKAVNRINQAIDNFEKITIYGDYDADGITATTIMYDTLAILGADVHYFIPDRFKDGYGPSMTRYQDIVEDGTKLIITVDNGVTGIQEVQYAQDHGCDVIVTDHHTFQEQKPAAFATVHCNYPGQKYPFDDYCGAGVAYTICRALMDDTMPELIELAMIGTIGDMVKVSGEGHILVKRGLELINHTQRPGLRALIKKAGLDLGRINETDIGFQIAPRLNACGRLASASLAVDLLLAEDIETAEKLADEIETLNNKRKELTQKVFTEAMRQRQELGFANKKTLVLFSKDWHEGVLGLVANKVVEQTHQPTIMLTEDENGLLKGSGRSTEGFNLFDALSSFKDEVFEKFGGHDYACGMSLKTDKLEILRQKFEASFKTPKSEPENKYDMQINPQDLTPEILSQLQHVGPFGTDNEEPIFQLSSPNISSLFLIGKDKNHIKFTVDGLNIVGFNMSFLKQNLLPFVKAIYITLGQNIWQKKVTLQGQVQGIEFGAPTISGQNKVIDFRSEKHILGFADKFLFFDEKNIDLAVNRFGLSSSQVELVNDYHSSGEIVTLIDAPHSRVELDNALQNDYRQLYLRFMLDQLPVKNIPNRVAFAKTLKYIYSHPGLKPSDYRLVAPFLGLDGEAIYFILRVFLELDFVKMDKEKLNPNQNAGQHQLTDSRYYLACESQVKFVNSLRTMPTSKLLTYVNQHLN